MHNFMLSLSVSAPHLSHESVITLSRTSSAEFPIVAPDFTGDGEFLKESIDTAS